MIGKIHSIESMGLVDGPGIRTVVFMQGCSLRCVYCHNPDTWSCNSNAKEISPQELVNKLVRFKPYYSKNGGVTFSGGEPLLQKDFLKECLKLCRENGIHTCIDTAGAGLGDYKEILKYTDLVLFDVKHYTPQGYKDITGKDISCIDEFVKCLKESGTPLWIRQVVVPGLTDSDEYFKGLKEYIKQFKNIQKTELIPYHTLGVHKYEKLNIPYPLKDVPPADKKYVENCQKYFND